MAPFPQVSVSPRLKLPRLDSKSKFARSIERPPRTRFLICVNWNKADLQSWIQICETVYIAGATLPWIWPGAHQGLLAQANHYTPLHTIPLPPPIPQLAPTEPLDHITKQNRRRKLPPQLPCRRSPPTTQSSRLSQTAPSKCDENAGGLKREINLPSHKQSKLK